MRQLIVVENPKRWPFDMEGVEVVPARSYLVEPRYAELKRAAVFNVCRRYGYQNVGYYVSLLAAARGHRPLPSVSTLQALNLSPIVRLVSEDLDDLIQKSFARLKSDEFSLSIYFGRNVAHHYDRLSRALFNQFPAPFLRARFTREEDGWRLSGIRPIAGMEIPETHRDFVLERAREYFERPTRVVPRSHEARYDMAVLWSPDDPQPPSDERAIKRLIRAAGRQAIGVELIGPDDYGRLAEFDALFLRETTQVNHHTFRMARRAVQEGLVVIDDPESIIRCTNKVYQAELFERHHIPQPRTMVVHEGNVDEIPGRIGLPCVLKRPDGSFSAGVVKVSDEAELKTRLAELFEESDLVVAQEFTPSAFDWRVGTLGGEPLYACRYHMARGHWQIVREAGAFRRYGDVDPVALEDVPGEVVEVAVRAARLIGDGLYGVDLKEIDGRIVVMEVNDNPNLDAGYEDGILKDALWDEVIRWFRVRLDGRGGEAARA
ncbi:MAG TPA: RimK family protein [Longimicrobiales bacterium]|nr:RimK family protein [Longimicrobiales bacterium]